MTGASVGKVHADWHDMSDFVVHFTKPSLKTDKKRAKTSYDNMMSILSQRKIKAKNRFGIAKDYKHSPKTACFSEIPAGQLTRLSEKRGPYGIGFTKEFLVEKKGGPIMYAYKDTTHAAALRIMLHTAIHKNKSDDPFWFVAPFIDLPGKYANGNYFYEWEREWRHPDDFKFAVEDVAFLILPEADHVAARAFFANAEIENIGPNYPCPFIDAKWDRQKVLDALASE